MVRSCTCVMIFRLIGISQGQGAVVLSSLGSVQWPADYFARSQGGRAVCFSCEMSTWSWATCPREIKLMCSASQRPIDNWSYTVHWSATIWKKSWQMKQITLVVSCAGKPFVLAFLWMSHTQTLLQPCIVMALPGCSICTLNSSSHSSSHSWAVFVTSWLFTI